LRTIRAQDPLLLLEKRLKDQHAVDDDALAQIDAEVERTVDAAVEFADESPEPNPEKLFEFSYATEVPNQPAALPGQPPWH
jgi:pyruvate dehydrogenase E1 component alpha subunit